MTHNRYTRVTDTPNQANGDPFTPDCPELRHIEQLSQCHSELLQHDVIGQFEYQSKPYHLHSFTLGNNSDAVPAIAFIGGVHGVERIGTQVVLAFLETLIQRLQWDLTLINNLNQLKLVFIPLVNPVGMTFNTRANGNGIDLMRNAPVDATKHPAFMVGGQRLSHRIPWYRGKKGEAMEYEAQSLCDVIEKSLFNSPFSLVLDVHSGFGLSDRLWFPYAHTTEPVQHLAEFYNLRSLLHKTYPYLDYLFEPQAHSYTTHGDLWDHLYMKANNSHETSKPLFLPITLEMGSWRWVKKNPRQLFNLLGLFNPMIPHRIQRVLRRHITLMEFLIRATVSYQSWLPCTNDRAQINKLAKELWYK